jgi:hypothetical protein
VLATVHCAGGISGPLIAGALLLVGALVAVFSHGVLIGRSTMKPFNEPSKMAAEFSPGLRPGVNTQITNKPRRGDGIRS